MILILILYLFWAAILFMNKAVMFHCTHPFFIGGLRSLVSGLLLILYSYFIRGNKISLKDLSAEEWKTFFISSFMLYGVAVPGFSLGINYVSPIIVSFLYSTAPFLTAGLLYLLQGESLSKDKIIGLLLGLAGVSVIILTGDESTTMSSSLSGVAIYLVSMLLLSYSWIVFKGIFTKRKAASLLLNGISMVIGGSIAFIFALLFKVPDESVTVLFIDHTILVVSFFATTAFCYGLYSYLLTKYSPTFLSFAGFLDPVFGILIGTVIFGHPFYMIYLFSFIILFIGLFIFYKEELKAS